MPGTISSDARVEAGCTQFARRSLITLAAVTLGFTALLAEPAAAQERPAPVVELAVGALLFPDDGITVEEGFIGGAGRFYLSPRLSVGPEIAYIGAALHSHLMLTGNLTFDFIGADGQPPRLTPFVVVGAGLFRTREEFGTIDSTHSEGAFTAGGGVRVRVGKRVVVGAEARVGWELHLRVNGMIGISLGGR